MPFFQPNVGHIDFGTYINGFLEPESPNLIFGFLPSHMVSFTGLNDVMMCAVMEYLSQHIQAPTTIKNKTSHVRTFLHMTGKRMEGADHTLIARALDSLLQNKNYVPIIKDAISMEPMCRALY